MAGRGLRSVLQPVLFVGIAALLHGILFLIPGSGPGTRDAGTSRGIRVKTYVEGPRSASPAPAARRVPDVAATAPDMSRARATDVRAEAGSPGGGRAGDEGGPSGPPGPSQGPDVGTGGPQGRSAFGEYLAHLRSDDVQGYARRSASASRRGWKGSGAGSGGWGAGSGTGSGTGIGSGGGSGSGTGGAGKGGYLDPRVRMVITEYPSGGRGAGEPGAGRNIEHRFRPVPYPDLKVKQSKFTSGWWNVYIELWTAKDGRIDRYNVLRPESDGPQERVFVEQVKREMARWTFDPGPSEVHVDVRFYVE